MPAAPAAAQGDVSIHTRHYWRVKQREQTRATIDAMVSIHTRHYWRVKLGQLPAAARQKTGFNPHPPLLAGETAVVKASKLYRSVSIHTRHYWRVKRVLVFLLCRLVLVSIHTRHYWRVKLGDLAQDHASIVSIHTRHYWRVKQLK